MDSLTIAFNDNAFQVELLPSLCPQTLGRLNAHMPFRTELHYAKIAGEEIMGVMPFNAPLENTLEVSQVKAGMMVFWPERHLLCLYYGKMQEEAASISLLGYLKGDTERFTHAGEQVRREQGKGLIYGSFYGETPKAAVPVITPTHATLLPFEYKIWERLPNEILQLTSRRGIMQPAGPVLYAEADTHAFHEFLVTTIRMLPEEEAALACFSDIFCMHLKAFHQKMAGWYLLPDTASVIKAYLNEFSRTCDAGIHKSLLENLMLFIGRLNFWFDALIPWDEFNEYMKKNPLQREFTKLKRNG